MSIGKAMKKADFMKLVGKNVNIILFDGEVKAGELCFVDEFSAKHGFKRTGFFYIKGDNLCFRFSHITKIKEVPDWKSIF